MKLFKYLSIVTIALVVVFTSCKKDKVEEKLNGPKIEFQNGNTGIEYPKENKIDVNVTFTADYKIETINLEETDKDGNVVENKVITKMMGVSADVNAKGEKTATYLFKISTADLVTKMAGYTNGNKLTFKFIVKDKEGTSATKAFVITFKVANTPLSAEKTFLWERNGSSAATGLAKFGLEWKSNAKAVHAQITPAANAKMVILTKAVWDVTVNKTALMLLVDNSAAATKYTGVNVTGSTGNGIYDDYIATKVGTEYFLIHITDFNIPSGVKRQIGGKYKE
jgi:hypothetical protein